MGCREMGICGGTGDTHSTGDTLAGDGKGSARARQHEQRGQRGLGAVHPTAPCWVPAQWQPLQREVTKLISLLRLSSFLRLFLDTAI